MTDLFDIANLITAVGVDGVKIKQEPGLPEKSSNQILTELFSTFDTPDDSIALPLNSAQVWSDDVDKTANNKSDELQTKKKIKKKNKYKEKKHKKKSKHDSPDNSDADGSKRKKKHKKKSKRRHESVSSKSSDLGHSKTKIAKMDNDNDYGDTKYDDAKSHFEVSDKISMDDKEKPDIHDLKKDSDSTDKLLNNLGSPQLPPISKKDDEFDEPVIPKLLEKAKQPSQGKILIKDLKNSTVYNETVKAIENKQKAKAAGMEDGELSDSSSEDNNTNRTPTLSPTPPRNRSSSFSPNRDKIRNKMFSPTKELVTSKTDLRLVLKERERKRSKRDKDSHSQDRRSRSRTRYNSRSSRSDRREKQRSRSREKRDSDRSREKYRYRNHIENKDKYTRGRSVSRERKERIEINKKKLLEIARKNVISMIKQGTLSIAQQDKAIAAIQTCGKTVDELTDFCKSLSKSEALGELSSISSEGEESESEKGFHHPFLLKERPSSIIMNIKDAKQLPTKTFQEKTAETSNQLRLQFPVSSGQHHRKSENEWVPVTSKKPEPKKIFVPASTNAPLAITLPPPVQPVQTVFPTTTETVDIGSIVSERLAAIRKLRENPNDINALNAMQRAQNEMKTWAESKQIPGQFTGSTGVKVLTPAELSSGYQAWARKDQLVSAQPLSGGMGMALLQKMGWRPGEGLGKNKEGALEPLQLEVKLDKKGLISEQDIIQKVSKTAKPMVPITKTLEGKHPVSLLGEYCTKKKLGIPIYELCFESGPDHRKNFLFKVKVNGIEYKPSVASSNKKQAKAEAAQICLQNLGLLPS
ncbi:PREDICTED: protein SON isoform X1 [Cyphomyrmex costatus]|uniref:protein SON isoform X1 n=1 Tax=Cyphomyrmex costatus TaxID=456900 RepID=UPI00085237AC|nr:PREDICTED: protein SON isoform X1 [Cyphomyrmex costatus]